MDGTTMRRELEGQVQQLTQARDELTKAKERLEADKARMVGGYMHGHWHIGLKAFPSVYQSGTAESVLSQDTSIKI
jgi:hypothetical protein